MKAKQKELPEKSSGQPTQLNWRRMNRKQRRDLERKIQSAELTLQLVHPDAAGIDIGNESHYVAVPPDRGSQPVRHFRCTTAELRTMADWLKQCRIRTVAMQSTSVYWIAVYDVLEHAGLEVYLVNARETKNLLTQMNMQLANVLSDGTGVTGQAIIKAILAGERDPQRLAAFRDPGVKASEKDIARSLEGNWQEDLLFVLSSVNSLSRTFPVTRVKFRERTVRNFSGNGLLGS